MAYQEVNLTPNNSKSILSNKSTDEILYTILIKYPSTIAWPQKRTQCFSSVF